MKDKAGLEIKKACVQESDTMNVKNIFWIASR